MSVDQLIGSDKLRTINPAQLHNQGFGEHTIKDLVSELQKPNRDPRPEFRMAKLTEGVETIKQLSVGAIMEGTISNVTNFGAFVDLGVHQDGLVHISALSDKFVKDPHEVVKSGDIVKVKVMQVDIARKRIGLSMRLNDEPPHADDAPGQASQRQNQSQSKGKTAPAPKPKAKSEPSPSLGSMAQKLMAAQARLKK